MSDCIALNFFNKITKLPRPSGKEKIIVQYLIDFAKKHELRYEVCGANNLIIYKPATNGKNSTIILQSHLDMVCEKDIDTEIDFDTESIETIIDGDFIKANGTTLGADNGVGVAIILSILQNKNLKHCNIEALFTTQEETTMEGARTVDYSLLNGKAILSLDGTNELCIDSASAGMTVLSIEKDLTVINNPEPKMLITMSGLKGGHSGEDIDKNRSNAIKVMTAFLKTFRATLVCTFNGGNKDNAIPRDCKVLTCHNNLYRLNQSIERFNKEVKENNIDDSEFTIKHEIVEYPTSYSFEDNAMLLNLLEGLPNGVIKANEEGFTLTSCNLASITTNNEKVTVKVSVRSSVQEEEVLLIKAIKKVARKNKFKVKILSTAPFFEENKNSELIALCKKTYKDLYNKEVASKPIHAGLEGGVFAQNIENADICVIGANLYDIHSTSERASISSIERVEKWVEKIVEEF